MSVVPVPVVGVSIGSDAACVAVIKDGRPTVVANEYGDRTTPTCVAWSGTGELLVGVVAKQETITHPRRTVTRFLDLLGKRYDDLVQESYPFDVVEERGEPVVSVEVEGGVRRMTPVQLLATVLGDLKRTAEGHLGQRVQEVSLAVPVHFSRSQRDTLLAAAEKADLNIAGMIAEPVAAALAFGYGSESALPVDETLLIFDLGGKSLTVTILKSFGGVFEEVITRHDPTLGGLEFDKLLCGHFETELKRKHRIDISDNRRARAKLLMTCQQVKRTLSQSMNAPCAVESLQDGVDFHSSMNRSLFESTTNPLINRCVEFVKSAIAEASLRVSDIHAVLMVGGSSSMLNLQQALRSLFKEAAVRVETNPEETIACGAALHGVILQDQDDVDPSLLHAETMVIPHAIGIASRDDRYVPVLRQFSPLPIRRVLSLPTDFFSGESKEILIYAGEDEVASKNTLLTKITFSAQVSFEVQLIFDMEIDGSFRGVVQRPASDPSSLAKTLSTFSIPITVSV